MQLLSQFSNILVILRYRYIKKKSQFRHPPMEELSANQQKSPSLKKKKNIYFILKISSNSFTYNILFSLPFLIILLHYIMYHVSKKYLRNRKKENKNVYTSIPQNLNLLRFLLNVSNHSKQYNAAQPTRKLLYLQETSI